MGQTPDAPKAADRPDYHELPASFMPTRWTEGTDVRPTNPVAEHYLSNHYTDTVVPYIVTGP